MSLKIDLTVAVVATQVEGIAAAQVLAGAGDLTLAANTVGGGGQMVTITALGDASGINFTIEGTPPGDPGKTISTTVVGPNVATLEVDYFGTVTRVYADAGSGGDEVAVGWTDKGVSKPWPCDVRQTPFNIGFGCVIQSGTPTFSVQHTFDAVFGSDIDPLAWQWFTNSSINGENTNTDGNYAAPVSAIRMAVNGVGVVTLNGYQAVLG